MKNPVRFLVFALTLFAAWMSCQPVSAERLALVIGNSGYRNADRLPNARRDAEAMADTLRRLGYTVVDGYDLDLDGMQALVRRLEDTARQAAPDVVLAYFAGHGIQLADRNYLLPVDFRLTRLGEVDRSSMYLNQILDRMRGARKLRVAIFDACRDNPFAAELARLLDLRSVGSVATRGLARIAPPDNRGSDVLVAFASEANTVAEDGAGLHSPYTAELLKHIATPGLELRTLFERVRDGVQTATQNRQRPFVSASLGSAQYWLAERPAAITQAAGSPPAVKEPPRDPPVSRRALTVGFRNVDDSAAIRQLIEKQIPPSLLRLTAEPDLADAVFVGVGDGLQLRLQNPALNSAAGQRSFARRAVAVGVSTSARPNWDRSSPIVDLVKSLKVIAENSDLLLLGRGSAGFRLSLSTGNGQDRFVNDERLSYTLRSEKDAHLLLIAASSDGSVNILLPNQLTPVARAAAGQPVTLPSGGEYFFVTAPFGTDLIKSIAFLDKPPFLNELIPKNTAYSSLRPKEMKRLLDRIAAWMDANPGRYAETALFIETTER
ncbi:caspase family protein [Azospirillum agricola]|uniref:caspase family protein n=1 Tax=Azospirillum agricola TaxID=1720247 RepID=UPI000A0F1220|nr:caspase family protein [Azospirillum agricola]SMH47933.1 Uncharacterized protein, contains caspase domain [Azospirillum lipoferum]